MMYMKTSRKYKRKTYTRTVTFTVQGIEYHGVSEDFSAGGIFIRTDESFSLGQTMVLAFPLSDKKKQVEFHAEIVRVMDDGIAVEFLR